MTLNLGPQHPATHGTLRIVAKLDGEKVVAAEPIMGYMHRGYEKLTEVRTYPQVTTLVNRIDWLGSFANEVPFILAAEQLMEVEAPPRAQWIRTVLFELSRIANISLFLGDMAVQVGATTPVFYAFRDREFVLNQIERVTGGRFHPNFDRIGGLKDDLPKGWIDETGTVIGKMRDFCDEMEELVLGNEIFQARTRGIGVIPPEVALSYGLSGANLRGSGVDWDIRRHPSIKNLRLGILDLDCIQRHRKVCLNEREHPSLSLTQWEILESSNIEILLRILNDSSEYDNLVAENSCPNNLHRYGKYTKLRPLGNPLDPANHPRPILQGSQSDRRPRLFDSTVWIQSRLGTLERSSYLYVLN